MQEIVTEFGQTSAGRNGHGSFPPTFPTLWPHMLLARPREELLPFPLDHPHVRFFSLARYGIYELAERLSLRGHEVLFPAYFHRVELEALTAAGVRVRFFPVHEGMRVDPDEVASLITPATRAVYLIHYGGFPGPVRELDQVARARGLRLIEDCALALLSRHHDRPLGSFGDAAVFCLYKTLPLPDGGAAALRDGWVPDVPEGRPPSRLSIGVRVASSLVLNLQMRGMAGSEALRRAMLALRQPRRRAEEGGTGRPAHFDIAGLGEGISTLSRRLLRSQDYPQIIERRRRNYSLLLERLGDVAPPVSGDLRPGVCPLFYPIQVRNRQAVLDGLRGRGIQVGEFWPEPHPAVPSGTFPEVDRLRATALWLPCHQDLRTPVIERLARAVFRVVVETACSG